MSAMPGMGLRGSTGWVPWFILLGMCIFFGAFLHAELQFVALALVIASLYSAQGSRAKRGAPMLILSLLVVQNLAIGLGAHLGGNGSEGLSYLTQVPFAVTLTVFCSVVAERIDRPMVDGLNKWFWLLVVWSAFMFVFGHASSLAARLVTLRNLTTWFMAFCVARAYLETEEDRRHFYRQLGYSCAAVSLVGFVGMALSFEGWLNLGLREVYIAKQAPMGSFSGWSGRFVTSIDGKHNVLRMISTYYEPVNLAYLLSAGAICVASTWRKRLAKTVCLIVVGLGLIWSFGKGGWVVTGALAAYLAVSSSVRRRSGSPRELSWRLAWVIAGFALALIAYYLFVGGAVRPHFWAVIDTWGNVMAHPLGHGLGTGGNAAASLGSTTDDWLASGGESALMSFAYQIGIPGVFFLSMSLMAVSRSNLEVAATTRGSILLALPVVLLGVSLLQDNTFTPQCIVPFMLMLGAFSREEIRSCQA